MGFHGIQGGFQKSTDLQKRLSALLGRLDICEGVEEHLEAGEDVGEVAIDSQLLHGEVAHGVGALPLAAALHNIQEGVQVECVEAAHAGKARRDTHAAARHGAAQRHHRAPNLHLVIALVTLPLHAARLSHTRMLSIPSWPPNSLRQAS